MARPRKAPDAPSAASFATPDPALTTEALSALLVGVVTNLIVLFGLDLSEARKAAIVGIVNASVAVGFLIYSAIVRHGRAVGNSSRQ